MFYIFIYICIYIHIHILIALLATCRHKVAVILDVPFSCWACVFWLLNWLNEAGSRRLSALQRDEENWEMKGAWERMEQRERGEWDERLTNKIAPERQEKNWAKNWSHPPSELWNLFGPWIRVIGRVTLPNSLLMKENVIWIGFINRIFPPSQVEYEGGGKALSSGIIKTLRPRSFSS